MRVVLMAAPTVVAGQFVETFASQVTRQFAGAIMITVIIMIFPSLTLAVVSVHELLMLLLLLLLRSRAFW